MTKLTLVAAFGCAVVLSTFSSGAQPIAMTPAATCDAWEQRVSFACVAEDTDALFDLIAQIPEECTAARHSAMQCYKKYTAIIPVSAQSTPNG